MKLIEAIAKLSAAQNRPFDAPCPSGGLSTFSSMPPPPLDEPACGFWQGLVKIIYFSRAGSFAITSVILAFLISASVAMAQEELSIEDCVQKARVSNPVVSLSQAKVKEAQAGKREMLSYMLPQLTAKGVWDNHNETLSGELTQFQDFKSNTAFGLSFRQGLWDFGATWNQFKASTLFVEASEWQQKKMLHDLDEQVRKAYLRVLEAERAVEVAQASQATLSKQHETTKSFFEQGLVTKRDTISVELQLTQKKRELLAAKNEASRAVMELNRLIGHEIYAPLKLKGLSEKVGSRFDVQEVLDFAIKHRPELIALSKKNDALGRQKRSLLLSNAPNFYAFTNADFSSDQSTVSAGIGMQLSLFEGGKTRAQIAKVRAQRQETAAMIRDFKDRLAVEIQAAILQLQEEETSLEIGKQAIELAKSNFGKTEDLYKEGHASINDILYAEELLSQSSLRYYSSLYHTYATLYHLSTLAGGYPLQNEIDHAK